MDYLILGTGTNYRSFNTYKNVGTSPDGTLITLAGTPALRARINGGDWVNAGLTLSVDHDFNGASACTGSHRVAIDVDNVTLALVAGDVLSVDLQAGTVNSVSQVNSTLLTFRILADGLTTAEKANVETEVEDGLADFFGIVTLTLSGTPSETAFTVDVDVGASVNKVGLFKLNSGALSGETCLVKHNGTTVTVIPNLSNMPGVLKQYTSAPASGVTGKFKALW